MNPTVAEIVELYLKGHGYDGLYQSFRGDEGESCGCRVGDLFPCGYPENDECRAGYKNADGGIQDVKP